MALLLPRAEKHPALSLCFPWTGLVPQGCVLGADVLLLLLNLMGNVGSLVPCLLRILRVPFVAR